MIPGRAIQRSVGIGLAILALLGLNACATVDYPAAVHSSKWTDSTECFGRYQISLPAHHRGGTGMLMQYDDWALKAYPRYWNGTDMRREALEAIQKMRKGMNLGSNAYVTDRVLKAGRSFMYVTKAGYENTQSKSRQEDLKEFGLPYDTMLIHFAEQATYWVEGGFLIKYIDGKPQPNANIIDTEINNVQKLYMDSLVNRMRELEPNEIPVEPGVCMNGSFIADDGKPAFFAKTSFVLSDYPGTYLSMITGGTASQSDKPLLEREVKETDSTILRLLANAKYGTVRKGKRDINSIAGSEKLVKWGGNRYLFRWESDAMDVSVTLESGNSGKTGSTLSQDEVLAAWDSILPTFKKRGE